jgi:hypothetical protein
MLCFLDETMEVTVAAAVVTEAAVDMVVAAAVVDMAAAAAMVAAERRDLFQVCLFFSTVALSSIKLSAILRIRTFPVRIDPVPYQFYTTYNFSQQNILVHKIAFEACGRYIFCEHKT